jgi:hypothetical protein
MSTLPPPSEDSLAAGLVMKPVKLSPTRLRPQPPPPPRRQWRSFMRRGLRLAGITSLLMGAGTLVGLSLWTGAVLILRPHPPRWLATYLPEWSTGWSERSLQTLADIEAELQPQQRRSGTWVELSLASADKSLQTLALLPVLETRSPCQRNCEAIVELRLYQRHRTHSQEQFQLLHQLPVKGPLEEEIVSPVANGDVGTMGSTYQLPLASLKPLYEEGLPGGWLTLTGRWRTQGSPVLYGQLLYINPQTWQIHPLLNWQSPPGRLPAWHNIDGEGLPELLVNQSYGLEPRFNLYRVENLTAINATAHLQEISLTPLSLPAKLSEKSYRDALFLAQQGLWSDAIARLTTLKTQAANQWSQELEGQFQLIQLHARFSQNQADRDWSQPSQKLLALLLDGQWKTALTTVTDDQNRYERAVLPLLERDAARIWPRLTAALQVNPQQKELKLWGALLLMAKEDQAAALKWLTQNQTQNTGLKAEFEAIAQQVSQPDPAKSKTVPVATTPSAPDAAPAATPTPSENRSSSVSSLFGFATPVADIAPEAWRPTQNTNLRLAAGQQWYVITLQRAYGSQQWQTPITGPPQTSPAAIAAFLPTLGLDPNFTLQLVDPASGQIAPRVQIRAVQQQGQTLRLLASGPASSTSGALMAVLPGQWRSPAASASRPLLALLQEQPELGDRLLTTLNSHLGVDPETLKTTLAQQAGSPSLIAQVEQINLIGTPTPEQLLTFSPDLTTYLNLPVRSQVPISLILTEQGELLYSSLWAGATQSFVGWLEPPAGMPALVVTAGDRATLLTWSAQHRRFQ